MRFRYEDAEGNEIRLSATAELVEKVGLGEVTATTRLYDAARDAWAPAGEHAIYRHIVENEVPEGPASSSRPTSPPLEDFWGPAMSVSGPDEPLQGSDLPPPVVPELEAPEEPSAPPPHPEAGAPAEPSVPAERSSPDLVPEAGHPEEPEPTPPVAASDQPDPPPRAPVEREASRSPRRQRSRDAAVTRLEAIAREAVEGMDSPARGSGARSTAPRRVRPAARAGRRRIGAAIVAVWRWAARMAVAGSAGARGAAAAAAGAARASWAAVGATATKVRGAAGRAVASAGGGVAAAAVRIAVKGAGGARAALRGLRPVLSSRAVLWTGAVAGALLLLTVDGSRDVGEEVWGGMMGIAGAIGSESGRAGKVLGERMKGAPAEDADPATPEAAGPSEGGPPDAAPPTGGDPAPFAAGHPAAAEETDPGDFEKELSLASATGLGHMLAAVDSMAVALELPDAPPEDWLGGYYLSHAGEFDSVRRYWSAYRSYLRGVKAQDAVLFRRGLASALQDLEVQPHRRPDLIEAAAARFRAGRAGRDSLYDAMSAVAEAAVDLHDFLVEREAEIEYDPVRTGRISRDPVLEAYASGEDARAALEEHLDRLLDRMERVNGLKPVHTDELQAVLFDNLRAADALHTFVPDGPE